MDRRKLSEELERDEGLRLKPYRCSAGKLTIGFGRNLEDVGLSEVEARILLDGDIERALYLCKKQDWFNALDGVRQRVIVNMAFNLGMPRLLQFKKMISALKSHDYKRASMELLDSLYARQVGARADRLAAMLWSGK